MFGDKARKLISKIRMSIAVILMVLNLKIAAIEEDHSAYRARARATQIQELDRDDYLEGFHAMFVDREDQS